MVAAVYLGVAAALALIAGFFGARSMARQRARSCAGRRCPDERPEAMCGECVLELKRIYKAPEHHN